MPIYEFECRSCGERFERLVSNGNAERQSCHLCGATQPRRLISVIAGMTGRAAEPGPVCGAGACESCS